MNKSVANAAPTHRKTFIMIGDNFYKRDEKEILKSLAILYPPIAEYFHTVTWEVTDDGNFPGFDAPDNILTGLNEALAHQT